MNTDLDIIHQKYAKFIHMVRRMRGAQKEFLKYYAREDKEIMQRRQREVDNFIDQEIKENKSLQLNIKFNG